jgi:hypothetical protein
MGLSCCKVTEHRYWIVSDEIEKLALRFQIETNLENFSRDEWDESLVQYFYSSEGLSRLAWLLVSPRRPFSAV